MTRADSLADPPDEPGVPTRRAIVIAAITFAVGIAAGGAGGYAWAASAGTEDAAPRGDAQLAELHHLAVDAPIAELVERRLQFTDAAFRDHPQDPVMWCGIARLCDATLGGVEMTDRAVFARTLAQVIEKADPAMTREVIGRVAALRQVR